MKAANFKRADIREAVFLLMFEKLFRSEDSAADIADDSDTALKLSLCGILRSIRRNEAKPDDDISAVFRPDFLRLIGEVNDDQYRYIIEIIENTKFAQSPEFIVKYKDGEAYDVTVRTGMTAPAVPSDGNITVRTVKAFTSEIVKAEKEVREMFSGICEKQEELDEIINGFSGKRRVERIARVSLAVLRIAIYEIKYAEKVPTNVAVSEAVRLAKKFAMDSEIQLVNGILGAYSRSLGGNAAEDGR